MKLAFQGGRRPLRRSVAQLAAGLLIIGSAAACGDSGNAEATSGSPGSASSEPFHILGVLGTSGPTGASAAPLKWGYEAAVRTINDKGGVLGRKVEMKFVDSQ